MRYLAITIALLLSLTTLTAAKIDTIRTTYHKGEYTTIATQKMVGEMIVADSIVNELIRQFRHNPEQLFDWAFKGIGSGNKEKEKDEVVVVFKNTDFDKNTEIGTLFVDILIPGVKNLKNIAVKSKITKIYLKDSTIRTDMDILYSNSLLQKAYGTLFVYPLPNGEIELRMEMHIKFGWFFNLFITQKRYRNLIEWRTEGFINNLYNAISRPK